MSTEQKAAITVSDTGRQDNSVIRFLFDNHGVRGEIMHMHEPCVKLLQNHNYPSCVNRLMLEMAGAAVMIAATLKAEGTVTVQLMGGKGEHALRFAFVNIDKELNFYGSASLLEGNNYAGDLNLQDLAGEGAALVISVFPEDGKKYQGYVPLEKDTLAGAIEDYFKSSEQLPTSFFLFCDEIQRTVSGIMLQIIPEIEGNTDSLEHLSILAGTLTQEEADRLSLHECLRRLFAEEKVRVFEPYNVNFRCTCSKERYLDAMRSMSLEDLEDMAQERDGLVLTCNNCGAVYTVSREEILDLINCKKAAAGKSDTNVINEN